MGLYPEFFFAVAVSMGLIVYASYYFYETFMENDKKIRQLIDKEVLEAKNETSKTLQAIYSEILSFDRKINS